jgi:hypothetical protein
MTKSRGKKKATKRNDLPRYEALLKVGVTADGYLYHYLEGKLLERPDYGFSTEVSDADFVNRWKQAEAIDEAERKKNNNGIKRSHRL